MKNQMTNIIGKMLSDNEGNSSSMRILNFLIIGVVLFNWTFYNMTNSELIALDWEEVGLLVGALGAKAYQKGIEINKKEK